MFFITDDNDEILQKNVFNFFMIENSLRELEMHKIVKRP